MSEKGNLAGESVEQGETAILTEKKEPHLYHVLLHNDDLTPMDFVVTILMKYFNKKEDEAVDIMFRVHNDGQGVCGTYVLEIAETKVNQVKVAAKNEGHPLQCSLEET